MLLAVAAAGLMAEAARAGERYGLAYRHRPGERSTYDVFVDLKTQTSIARLPGGQTGEAEKDASSAATVIRLVMDAVPDKVGAGQRQTIALTFSGAAVTQTLDGPAGEYTVEIRGEDVVVKKGDKVAIDTQKGKGVASAAAILRELAFLGKNGSLAVNDSGRVLEVSGPDEFKAFLNRDTGAGLFPLETPAEPIAVGESWKSSERVVQKLRSLDFSARPLDMTLTYSLLGVEEHRGRKCARISVKSELRREDQSATAATETVSGQSVTIKTLVRKAGGHVLFDLDRGEVVESSLSVKLDMDMEIKIDDKPVRAGMSGTAEVAMTLRETAPAVVPGDKQAPAAPAE